MSTAVIASTIFIEVPACVTPYTEAPSNNNAGILPTELAITKTSKETLPIADANVTSPEGTKGNNRNEKIKPKALPPSARTSFCRRGNFCSCVDAFFLNPFRYNKKETTAPNASPKKEMRMPSQKPKNKMLAAVIKTLGRTPITAINILMATLIKIASC